MSEFCYADVARKIDEPRTGYFKIRLCKGGPWVGAIIYRPCPMNPVDWETDPSTWCTPTKETPDLAAEIDGIGAVDVDRVWLWARDIPHKEWLYLTKSAAWDREFAPDSPAANPYRSINLGSLDPIF